MSDKDNDWLSGNGWNDEDEPVTKQVEEPLTSDKDNDWLSGHGWNDEDEPVTKQVEELLMGDTDSGWLSGHGWNDEDEPVTKQVEEPLRLCGGYETDFECKYTDAQLEFIAEKWAAEENCECDKEEFKQAIIHDLKYGLVEAYVDDLLEGFNEQT